MTTTDYRELAEHRHDRSISVPSQHYLALLERIETLEQLVFILAAENRLEKEMEEALGSEDS